MPWEKTDMGEQRVKFVVRAASGKERMSALCREFGVSRPTGYRWPQRFQQAGSVTAIVERSRRPEHSPAQTARDKEERVVALRQEHGWGAKKAGNSTARRKPAAHGDHHQPDIEAARFGEEEGFARSGDAAV